MALIPFQSLLVTTFLPDDVLHVLQLLLLRWVIIATTIMYKLGALAINLGNHIVLLSNGRSVSIVITVSAVTSPCFDAVVRAISRTTLSSFKILLIQTVWILI